MSGKFEREVQNMMNLKEIVFFRTLAELEGYRMMTNGNYTEEEKNLQLERFCSAYQIIEEAELEEEYQEWKEKQGGK